MPLGKLVSMAMTAMVVLAVIRKYDGDPTAIVNGVWGVLSAGADVVTLLFDKVMGAATGTEKTSG